MFSLFSKKTEMISPDAALKGRDAAIATAEHSVGCGAAIAGHDTQRLSRFQHALDARKNIDGLDIVVDDQVFAPVAQQEVYLSLGFGNVLSLNPIDGVRFFPGTFVHKVDAANIACPLASAGRSNAILRCSNRRSCTCRHPIPPGMQH